MGVRVGDLIEAFQGWIESQSTDGRESFRGYVHGIAQARYVIRRVFRIIDEQAKKVGLDPLQHQALLQLYGQGDPGLSVNQLAERLDIAPAFASRLVKQLEGRGLVLRSADAHDRRAWNLQATEAGIQALRDINEAVRVHVEYFQAQLSESSRFAAMTIFAFYLGLGDNAFVTQPLYEGLEQSRPASGPASRPTSAPA
jgi:DNA-binding MarR family transcriptional regulator